MNVKDGGVRNAENGKCARIMSLFVCFLGGVMTCSLFHILFAATDPWGVLNFELGTDVRPEVSTTTL